MELDRCMKTGKILANIVAELETGNYAVMKMSVALQNKGFYSVLCYKYNIFTQSYITNAKFIILVTVILQH